MFEDVAEMEREIETFRKNVVASSELVEGIFRLTAETKKQKESFAASTEELLRKLDSCVAQFKSDHESALQALSDSNGATIETLQKNMSAEQQAKIGELEGIRAELQRNLAGATAQSDEQVKHFKADCAQIITETKSTLEAQQKAYAEKLQETETVIQGYQSSAEAKYSEFVSRLETTKESFAASTEELLRKLDSCVAQFKSDHESALQALSDSNGATIETLQKNMSAEQQAKIGELEGIRAELQRNLADATAQSDEQVKHFKADCAQIITETKSTLEAQQKAYAEKLQETETVIQGYQSSVEAKYSEFVSRLETTNVDQIFKEVQDLKKSIQAKFAILIGGIGLTLIISLLSVILK